MGSMEAEYETNLGYRLAPWPSTLDDFELSYDDDDEIAYFTVRWKTRELVLSTAPKNEITPTKTVKVIKVQVQGHQNCRSNI